MENKMINEERLAGYHDELMKTHIVGGCVFDISAYHATGTPPVLAEYADLSAALGTKGANVPESMRKGGMSVKFVSSSDHKYVQYRLMADTFSTTESDWQGVDDKILPGSSNLVNSIGLYEALNPIIGNYSKEMTSVSSVQKRAVIEGTFRNGDSIKVWSEGTAVTNSISVRYDDNTSIGTISNNGDSVEFVLQQDTSCIVAVVNNVTTEETIMFNIEYGYALRLEASTSVEENSKKLIESGSVYKALYGQFVYEQKSLSLTNGRYYSLTSGGSTVSPNTLERTDTSCAELSVSAGDEFVIYGVGTDNIRLYIFTDSSNKVLDSNSGVVNYRESGKLIKAPNNATKLFINFFKYNSSYDKLYTKVLTQEGLKQMIPVIVNDLITGGADKALSAEQGIVINNQINGDYQIQEVHGIVEGKYRSMGGEKIGPITDVSSGSSWTCATLETDCSQGDVFKIYGLSHSEAIRLYAFTDSLGNIIIRAGVTLNSRIDGLEITAPYNATKLYCDFYNYDSSNDKLQKYVFTSIGLKQNIDNLDIRLGVAENEIDYTRPYKNKKIISFGDSITEFKWGVANGGDGKGWIDHTANILGCTFVNVAIGGTHMNDKYNIELFDLTHEYAVGDYVFYKPSSTMNLYHCIHAHSGAWDANDFEDVSEYYNSIMISYSALSCHSMIKAFCNISILDPNERFKDQIAAAECIYTWKPSHDDNRAIVQSLVDTDPSEIDVVIIAEGTNDYADVEYRGVSGSYDSTTTLGAVNESVRLLNQTYKYVPVFYITPPVRWWNWSGGTGNVNDFSDNYKANGDSDITLREWVEILKNEYKLNHIPVCDLYNELEWNQWNFANYFPDDDGTHPRPGFKNIGAKVASFLIAHNVIK